MARYYEPTAKQIKSWRKWAAKCPPVVKALAERFGPWTLYRLDGAGGSRVFVIGYNENGTLSVGVSGRFNFVLMERQVFGIRPEQLTECDLPGPDEPVGVAIPKPTEGDIAALREMMGIQRVN